VLGSASVYLTLVIGRHGLPPSHVMAYYPHVCSPLGQKAWSWACLVGRTQLAKPKLWDQIIACISAVLRVDAFFQFTL